MVNGKSIAVLFVVLLCLNAGLMAQENSFEIDSDKVYVYRNILPGGEEMEGRTSYHYADDILETGIAYTHVDGLSEWEVNADGKGNPSVINYSAEKGSLRFSFDGTGKVRVSGNWDGKTIDENKKFKAGVSLENASIVRSLDFSSRDKYVFDLLQTDKLPRIVAYRMYFKVMGNETITVPAGTFKCKKVRFSLKDWRSMFYKAYYYISDDEKRMIIKIDNVPKGGSSELVRIEETE